MSFMGDPRAGASYMGTPGAGASFMDTPVAPRRKSSAWDETQAFIQALLNAINSGGGISLSGPGGGRCWRACGCGAICHHPAQPRCGADGT